MKALTVSAIALSILGLAGMAEAQQGGRLFFEGDIVAGDGCVLRNQFQRQQKVVWRIRVLDQEGKSLDQKGLKSLAVELPDGQKLAARFGPYPPPKQGPAQDHFWTAAWTIPENYPSGTFAYKVVATDLEGKVHTWQPFIRTPSQLTVVAGTEPKKPQPKQ